MKKMICMGYFTGATGQSMGMFYFGDNLVAGADVGGIRYDGKMVEQPDGALVGQVKFIVPPGTEIITGLAAGQQQQEITAQISLPKGFAETGQVVRIDTPAGPVAARFEALRELP